MSRLRDSTAMTMAPEQYDWFRSDEDHDAELPHHRDPRTYPYGLYTSDAFVMSAVGMFFWFESRAEMAAYIRHVEPQIYELDEGERGVLLAALEAPLDALQAGTTDLEAARDAINVAASNHFVIEWTGTFEELCAGDGEWACEFRTSFREACDKESSPEPISADEVEAFVGYISEYGF